MKCLSLLCFLFPIFLIQCDKEGSSINAPAVEPPVTRNMPAGMLNLSLKVNSSSSDESVASASVDENGAATAETMISSIKNYLYPTSDGPSPIKRLESIDERMASLSKRSEESPKKCVEDALKDHQLPAAFPTTETLTLKVQCYEALNDVSELAFGMGASEFHLLEKTGNSSEDEAHFVTAVANLEGTQIDTWTISYSDNQDGTSASAKEASVMHIKGDDTTGIEVTTAGTLSGYSLSCGVHLKSNDDYVYIKGKISIALECTEEGTYCMDASTLTATDMSNCSAAGLDSLELTTLTLDDVTNKTDDIVSIVDSQVSGVTSFLEDLND